MRLLWLCAMACVAGLCVQHVPVYANSEREGGNTPERRQANRVPERLNSARAAFPGHLAVIQKIFQTPESEIDLAQAQLLIDRMIDPSIDMGANLAQLDAMARSIRAMLPFGASSRLTLDALRYHIYRPTPWNGHRPFQYDLDDPQGVNIRNKLLPNYLATRKGNCVSMPLLFIILGQKLGLEVTAATIPNHVFVKYRDSDGKWHNLEATSGASFARDVWMGQLFPMTEKSVATGIYMRPLTRKETVGVMLGTLMEHYSALGMSEQRIALARLVLQYDPRSITAILHQHGAYLTMWRQEFEGRYQSRATVPQERLARFDELDGRLKALYHQAHALGWRPLTQADEEKYEASIRRARAVHQP